MATLERLGTDASGAVFSPCMKYRYALWRSWKGLLDEEECSMAFIGLNPSTADHQQDDPTIRRCISFAKREGYTGLIMLNLFAFRATDPDEMRQAAEPVGEMNNQFLRDYCEVAGKTIACWGVGGNHLHRDREVARLSRPPYPQAKTPFIGDLFWCLGRTKDGFPRHPLYVKADAEITRFAVK